MPLIRVGLAIAPRSLQRKLRRTETATTAKIDLDSPGLELLEALVT